MRQQDFLVELARRRAARPVGDAKSLEQDVRELHALRRRRRERARSKRHKARA